MSLDAIFAAINRLPKCRPLVVEVRIHSLDADRVMEGLRAPCPETGPSCSPYAGPIFSDIQIRQDDSAIPGFIEMYDGRGNMIKTINLAKP